MRSGYVGPWTGTPTLFSNFYYKVCGLREGACNLAGEAPVRVTSTVGFGCVISDWQVTKQFTSYFV